MFCWARFQPSVCAWSLLDRAAPAASAEALVRRRPVESRSADTAKRLCPALMKREAVSDSAVTSKRIVMRQLEATQRLPALCYEGGYSAPSSRLSEERGVNPHPLRSSSPSEGTALAW